MEEEAIVGAHGMADGRARMDWVDSQSYRHKQTDRQTDRQTYVNEKSKYLAGWLAGLRVDGWNGWNG